ncbi:MAG: hypothetical protein IPM40_21230 [Gammaproteobacteria bacterium]|nr:hypothetical protein [Gammaproteobacteria bacterium]
MSDDYAERIRQAMKESEAIIARDPGRAADPTLPIAKVAAEYDLEAEPQRFEAGDRMALMGAMRICANHDLPMPLWVSRAFISAYDQVLNCKAKSWDTVFGNPYPKGEHLSARRKKRTKAPAVWVAINRAHKQGRAIDESLFTEVGKKLGLGKTLAAEYYYAQKSRIGPLAE